MLLYAYTLLPEGTVRELRNFSRKIAAHAAVADLDGFVRGLRAMRRADPRRLARHLLDVWAAGPIAVGSGAGGAGLGRAMQEVSRTQVEREAGRLLRSPSVDVRVDGSSP